MKTKILLLSDSSALRNIVKETFTAPSLAGYSLECISSLGDAVERLAADASIEATLIGLALPEHVAIDAVDRLRRIAPHTPMIVLGAQHRGEFVDRLLKGGAHDYLLTSHLDSYTLTRALHEGIERKRADAALFIANERAQVTLSSIGDAVLCTDASSNVSYLNPIAEAMTGWSCADAIGRPVAEILHVVDGQTRETVGNPTESAMREGRAVRLPANTVLIRRDGAESCIEDSAAPIRDWNGKIIGAVIVFHDVGEARANTLRMSHLAQHDYLTSLPNRLLLNDRLTLAIALARRHSKRLAVLFVDLDHLKPINDSLGHLVGDQLLRTVALRLSSCVRSSDTVCRQGGDEFVVLLSELTNPMDAAVTAEKIRTAITDPYAILGPDTRLTASIGISVYPDDGADPEALIRNADTAMYHAKSGGRNNYQFFREDMNLSAMASRSVEASLRNAVARRELLLKYQPTINLASGKVRGAEALIRWRHPDRGLLGPGHFIPLAEGCGLIGKLGRWVLREACGQARAWLDAGLTFDTIGVDISGIEFRDGAFLDSVASILHSAALEPKYLQLEIDEGVLMRSPESSLAVLQGLSSLGVRLAIDNFGTGSSSLNYLTRFSIGCLKIDRSFVRGVTTDHKASAVVDTAIAMARCLKLKIVAQGVETAAQLEYLRKRGCDVAQGEFFGRPMLANAFGAFYRGRGAKLVHAATSETATHAIYGLANAQS
jgi:diguanylate cyclase (GGDEF)-like protein/PAS domain S-box-containing protein